VQFDTSLNIPYIFQKTGYSCAASCLQMMLAAAGLKMNHWNAIRILKAYPDGTDVATFRRIYRMFTGRTLASVTIKGVRRAINRGVPVLAEDSVSSKQDHLVVVYGYDGDEYLVHDPALFTILRRGNIGRRSSDDLLRQSGNRFYSPRSSLRT
jgi:ABC-type bacteriocin/lantibiotic exporter with double-glycine peptidase domain